MSFESFTKHFGLIYIPEIEFYQSDSSEISDDEPAQSGFIPPTQNQELSLSYLQEEQQSMKMLEFAHQLTLAGKKQTEETFAQVMKEFKRTLMIQDEKEQIWNERVSEISKRAATLEEALVKNEKLRISEKNVTEEKIKAINESGSKLGEHFIEIAKSLALEIKANGALREQKLIADNRIVSLEGRVAALEEELRRTNKNLNDHIISHKQFLDSSTLRFKILDECRTAQGLRLAKLEGGFEGNNQAIDTRLASIEKRIHENALSQDKAVNAFNTHLERYKLEVAKSLDLLTKSKAATETRLANIDISLENNYTSIVGLDLRVIAHAHTLKVHDTSLIGLDHRVTAQAKTQTIHNNSLIGLDYHVIALQNSLMVRS